MLDALLTSLNATLQNKRSGRYQPGTGSPEPVPAADASVLADIPAFKPNTSFCVDPVPARQA